MFPTSHTNPEGKMRRDFAKNREIIFLVNAFLTKMQKKSRHPPL
jgi:hypothetical protein